MNFSQLISKHGKQKLVSLGDIVGIWEVRQVKKEGVFKLATLASEMGFLESDPIIVCKLARNKYVLLDGNHRVLVLHMLSGGDMKRTIQAVVFNNISAHEEIVIRLCGASNIKHDGTDSIIW
jgi:hypothetical protein